VRQFNNHESVSGREIVEHYDEYGFAVARGWLDPEKDLAPVVREYERLLDRLAERLLAEGKLSCSNRELPFGERLMCMVAEAALAYDQYFDISLPQTNISESTPIHCGPAVFDLLRNPRLLDLAEMFVGPEIYSNPVQHTRVKLPESMLPESVRTGLTVQIAQHQDLGVIDPEADQTEMLTVWFPITRATIDNGCLAVVPGSHRGELALHCRSEEQRTENQVCIPPSLLADQVPVPMEPGDVLVIHRKTRHAGLPNQSDDIRWSFDLRYQPTGQPTGRPWFPGFVARSRAHPESELKDAAVWAQSWHDARRELATAGEIDFNRWGENGNGCA
jgi:hypothetical protein